MMFALYQKEQSNNIFFSKSKVVDIQRFKYRHGCSALFLRRVITLTPIAHANYPSRERFIARANYDNRSRRQTKMTDIVNDVVR